MYASGFFISSHHSGYKYKWIRQHLFYIENYVCSIVNRTVFSGWTGKYWESSYGTMKQNEKLIDLTYGKVCIKLRNLIVRQSWHLQCLIPKLHASLPFSSSEWAAGNKEGWGCRTCWQHGKPEGVGISGQEHHWVPWAATLQVPFCFISVFPFLRKMTLSVVSIFHSGRGSVQGWAHLFIPWWIQMPRRFSAGSLWSH